MSVPAYSWAWTHHDVLNHHQRRYTRPRARAAVEGAGLEVLRATYAFAGTFPFFVADRVRTRLRERRLPEPDLHADVVAPLPEVGPLVERVLLGASRIDRRLAARSGTSASGRRCSSPRASRSLRLVPVTGTEREHTISVVIPVYQGEATLAGVVAELERWVEPFTTPAGHRARVAEVVLVHDCGPDALGRRHP